MKTSVKQEINDWALTVLLTLSCYLAVNNYIVSIPFWKYLIIEFVLVGARIFHKFAMKKLFPTTYRNS